MYVKCLTNLLKVWNKWRHTTKCQVSIRQMEEKKVIGFQKHIQHSKKHACLVYCTVKNINSKNLWRVRTGEGLA